MSGLKLKKHIDTTGWISSYIGKEVKSTIKELKEDDVVKEDCLGEAGYRKITMENYDERVIIIGEINTNATWTVLDVFISKIAKDQPKKPFKRYNRF